jgi:hypothetical protein
MIRRTRSSSTKRASPRWRSNQCPCPPSRDGPRLSRWGGVSRGSGRGWGVGDGAGDSTPMKWSDSKYGFAIEVTCARCGVRSARLGPDCWRRSSLSSASCRADSPRRKPVPSLASMPLSSVTSSRKKSRSASCLDDLAAASRIFGKVGVPLVVVGVNAAWRGLPGGLWAMGLSALAGCRARHYRSTGGSCPHGWRISLARRAQRHMAVIATPSRHQQATQV